MIAIKTIKCFVNFLLLVAAFMSTLLATTWLSKEVRHSISTVIIHPAWPSFDWNQTNDIALVRSAKRKINLNLYSNFCWLGIRYRQSTKGNSLHSFQLWLLKLSIWQEHFGHSYWQFKYLRGSFHGNNFFCDDEMMSFVKSRLGAWYLLICKRFRESFDIRRSTGWGGILWNWM